MNSMINFAITLLGTDLFMLGCAVVDTLRNHRLHPTFSWRALGVVVLVHLALLVTCRPWSGAAL